MKDEEIIKEIRTIIYNTDGSVEDYNRVIALLNQIENINITDSDCNLLRIVCTGICYKWIEKSPGEYESVFLERKYSNRRKYIDLIIKRGIDVDYKMGLYNAPLLFFVTDPSTFEYLCSIGFNPNERLALSGYEGYPYFSLHHDFSSKIYLIAKKYGFKPHQIISEGKTNLLHLFFSRFIETFEEEIEVILEDFEDQKNDIDSSGKAPIHRFILGRNLTQEGNIKNNWNLRILKFLIEKGFDPNIRTKNEVSDSENTYPANSSVYDIYIKMSNSYNEFTKNNYKDVIEEYKRILKLTTHNIV